jgi:hypothetical protein
LAEHWVVWLLLQGVAGFVGLFSLTSFFEWALHKYLMHSLLWHYPFHTHALVHHGIFRADHTYHLRREEDKEKVTFAWWNAPGLFLLHLPLLLGLAHFFGWSVFWGGAAALVAYYILYEYLHFCMHVPRDRWLEGTRLFQWINARHRLHHQYAFKNLNVVFPLADWLLGSLIPAPRDNRLSATEKQQTLSQKAHRESVTLS